MQRRMARLSSNMRWKMLALSFITFFLFINLSFVDSIGKGNAFLREYPFLLIPFFQRTLLFTVFLCHRRLRCRPLHFIPGFRISSIFLSAQTCLFPSLNGQIYRAFATCALFPCHATGIDRYLKAVEGDGNIVGVLIASFPFGVFCSI